MGSIQPVQPRVLIVGAGITGLLLAQALKKAGIAFSVYERDPTPTHRGAGWGLALHWALDTFLSLVPQELQDRLPETYVDPVAAAKGDNGRFPFFDLSTGEARYENLSPRRVRLSREKLRRLLMNDLDIQVRHSPIFAIDIMFTTNLCSGARILNASSTRQRLLQSSSGMALLQPALKL